jgi:hypothetical protein
MEASKPNTGFVNPTITFMSDASVTFGELVLSLTSGFVES